MDSHADLGLGYPTPDYISRVMLYFEPKRRLNLLPDYDDDESKQKYLANSKKEPEVAFEIIHSIEAFREYIEEI